MEFIYKAMASKMGLLNLAGNVQARAGREFLELATLGEVSIVKSEKKIIVFYDEDRESAIIRQLVKLAVRDIKYVDRMTNGHCLLFAIY